MQSGPIHAPLSTSYDATFGGADPRQLHRVVRCTAVLGATQRRFDALACCVSRRGTAVRSERAVLCLSMDILVGASSCFVQGHHNMCMRRQSFRARSWKLVRCNVRHIREW